MQIISKLQPYLMNVWDLLNSLVIAGISFEFDQNPWHRIRKRQMNVVALNERPLCAIIGSTTHRLCSRSTAMSSNADAIVAQIQQDMQALMTYVTGPETATQTAYTVELTLFRRVLALA